MRLLTTLLLALPLAAASPPPTTTLPAATSSPLPPTPPRLFANPRKMPANASEKFYPHYWNWPSTDPSIAPPIRAQAPPGSTLFSKRATYTCTKNTHACTNINRPAFCCDDDQDCVRIEDLGYGDVGCCTKGDSCSGNLSGCGDGKIACDRRIGGGCCNEGTVCSPHGCLDMPGEDTGETVEAPAEEQEEAVVCPTGFFACPKEVGGGCCRDGRSCEREACPAEDAAEPTKTRVPEQEEVKEGVCAAGWRECDVYDGGGCCPVGYQCGPRNCPEQTAEVTQIVGGILMEVTTTLGEVGKLPQKTGAAGAVEVGRGWVGMGLAVAVAGLV